MNPKIKCPDCGSFLQQLGDNVATSAGWIWEPMNLFRCQNCPYRHNRYFLDGDGMYRCT